jgi:hypothetical protein
MPKLSELLQFTSSGCGYILNRCQNEPYSARAQLGNVNDLTKMVELMNFTSFTIIQSLKNLDLHFYLVYFEKQRLYGVIHYEDFDLYNNKIDVDVKFFKDKQKAKIYYKTKIKTLNYPE